MNIKLGENSKKWNIIIIEEIRWEAVNSDSYGWMYGTWSTCVNPVTRLNASKTREKLFSNLTNKNFWRRSQMLGIKSSSHLLS